MGKNRIRLFEEKPFESKNIFGRPSAVRQLTDEPSSGLRFFNMALLVLVIVFGIWYALWTNFVISAQYHERLSKDKLDNLMAENNQLLSEKSTSANLGALLVFAKNSGLVEQKNIEYLFDRNNVAKR